MLDRTLPTVNGVVLAYPQEAASAEGCLLYTSRCV